MMINEEIKSMVTSYRNYHPNTDIRNLSHFEQYIIEHMSKYVNYIEQQQLEKVVNFTMSHGLSTGHADTLDDLLLELNSQVKIKQDCNSCPLNRRHHDDELSIFLRRQAD